MELLDIYDENRNFTGKRIVRGERRGKDEYGLAVAVWIVNSRGELLITLRSPEKESWPDYWENTSGAVQAGESSLEGCIRELREETGISAEPSEPVLMDIQRSKNTFFDSYVIKKDIAIDELRLQPGETVDAMWVTVERFEEMCADGSVAAPIAAGYRRVKPLLMKYINAV
ncbi:MAG: NUDIX domain-containing protein [Clostridiales bacterium]|nr:NUDIX domain-containing protein [Clostridiales bacterium]